MVALVVVVVYLILGILTARKLVYEMMCLNERVTVHGIPLEARLYTSDEYRRLIKDKMGDYGVVPDSVVPPSDLNGIVFKSMIWPMFWTTRLLRVMVLEGHKKTPGQREKELKEREREMKRLEAEREREWKNKLKEAGIEE